MKRKIQEGHYETLINIAYNGYSQYQVDFIKLYNVYKGRLEPDQAESLLTRRKSAIVVNKAYALVQRISASTKQAYFSNERFASFTPLTAYEENASEEMQKAFDHYWTKVMNPYLPMTKTWLDGYIYGTPVNKVYWSNNAPVIENISIHDIFFDPSAKESDDLRFVVNNVYMTWDDVKLYKKQGIYNKRFKMEDIQTGNSDYQEGQNNYTHKEQDEDTYGRVMIQDVYEFIMGNWYITSTYNKQTLLRERIFLEDGLPFFIGKTVANTEDYEGVTVGVYSDSLLAPIYDLQKELNVRVNQEIDAIAENINPSFFAERGSGLMETDLRKGPSKAVYLNNLSGIEAFPPPPLAPLQMNEERIRTDITEITGIEMIGTADTSAIVNRQTAEGMNILSTEKSLRPDDYIRTVNDTHTVPMVSHIAKLIWKYCNIPDFFIGIDRSRDYSFAVKISAGLGATSKQIQLNGLNQAFEKFMTLGDTVKAEQTIADSLPLLGIKNTAEYYEPMTKKEKKERKEAAAKENQAKAEQQRKVELRKIDAEISKLENESAKLLVESTKMQSEASISDKQVEVNNRVNLENIALENRKIDLEEQKLSLEIQRGIENE